MGFYEFYYNERLKHVTVSKAGTICC